MVLTNSVVTSSACSTPTTACADPERCAHGPQIRPHSFLENPFLARGSEFVPLFLARKLEGVTGGSVRGRHFTTCWDGCRSDSDGHGSRLQRSLRRPHVKAMQMSPEEAQADLRCFLQEIDGSCHARAILPAIFLIRLSVHFGLAGGDWNGVQQLVTTVAVQWQRERFCATCQAIQQGHQPCDHCALPPVLVTQP